MSRRYDHQPTYNPEKEQQDMLCIKRIGEQIFGGASQSIPSSNAQFEGDYGLMESLGANDRSQCSIEGIERKYSLTQRKFREKLDEFVGAHSNTQTEHMSIELSNTMINVDQQTDDLSKQINVSNNLSKEGSCKQRVNFQKIAMCKKVDAGDRNYLKPIGHYKSSAREYLQQLEKQKHLEELQFVKMMEKSHEKTLSQIYKEKLPLFQKCTMIKERKRISVEVGQLLDLQKESETFVGVPEINNNIQVKGNFLSRVTKAEKKKQQHQQHIMAEVLQPYSYKPRLNNSNKYKAESVVKKIWASTNNNKSVKLAKVSSTGHLRSKLHSKLQTNSCGNDDGNRNLFQAKLPDIQELSNALQIEDFLRP